MVTHVRVNLPNGDQRILPVASLVLGGDNMMGLRPTFFVRNVGDSGCEISREEYLRLCTVIVRLEMGQQP